MKLYIFLVCSLFIMPLLRIVESYHDGFVLINLFFCFALFILAERYSPYIYVKIIYSVLIGLIYTGTFPMTEQMIRIFYPVGENFFTPGGLIIHVPRIFESIFSFPSTFLVLDPKRGLAGAVIGLILMQFIHFIGKKRSKTKSKIEITEEQNTAIPLQNISSHPLIKYFYVFLAISVFIIIPLLRINSLWFSGINLALILFSLILLVLSEIIVDNDNIKIANAGLVGFIFGLILPISAVSFDRFSDLYHSPLFKLKIAIPVPVFIERIFSIPNTIALFMLPTAIFYSIISLCLMLLFRFVRKKYFSRPLTI
jgi:hypothetical protein